MKIAITANGKDMEAALDPRFGRAANFLMVDSETEEFTVLDNAQNLNAAQGAGIQAAQNVMQAGAEAVITGNCGPKAFRTLGAAKIKVFLSSAATVKEALKEYKDGKLGESSGANVEGHWV
jgi:predicted Fe-Mo cluster-binding NifX family protein